jgi:hypothetical protein
LKLLKKVFLDLGQTLNSVTSIFKEKKEEKRHKEKAM